MNAECFHEAIGALASMAGVGLIKTLAPTCKTAGAAWTETGEEAELFAALLANSGIAAVSASRNGKHAVYIG